MNEYFHTYGAFLKREDKKINGTNRKELISDHSSNEGCWNCENCSNCKNCNNCEKCFDCVSCIRCNNCKNCHNLVDYKNYWEDSYF